MKVNHLSFVLSASITVYFSLTMHGKSQTVQTLLDLTFSPVNAGDVASHPNVANILPWTNGSEVYSDVFYTGYMPDPDFGNGYAGLTVPVNNLGFQWGFHGGFDITGSNAWQVDRISFDYHVRGHNAEASLALQVGSWTSDVPLPSTQSVFAGPIFTPVTMGEPASGTVTFDFLNDLVSVTRTGYNGYQSSFSDTLVLTPGQHTIDMLTSIASNNGFFDVNSDTVGGSSNSAFYRIDNFVVTAQIPEPSTVMIAATGVVLLFRRRRVS